MFFMSTSVVLCQNLVLSKSSRVFKNSFLWGNALCCGVQFSSRRGKYCGLVPSAKKRHAKKRSWWKKFFFDEDGNWLGLKDDEAFELLEEEESSGEELSANEKFEAWKRRAEAIVELREAQEDVKNEENRRWEDWIVDGTYDDVSNGDSWFEDSNGAVRKPGDDVGDDFREVFSSRGLVKSVRDLVLGGEDDDILYEDRVFRFASFNSVSEDLFYIHLIHNNSFSCVPKFDNIYICFGI